MKKISGIYKIINTVTGDFYIGSSVDVNRRWKRHKVPSTWKRYPNSLLYRDMQKYGLDKFQFQIMVEIVPECLKQVEQDCIELMKPTYNNYNAKGINVERRKKTQIDYFKKYLQSEKGNDIHKKAQKRYIESEKGKKAQKKYHESKKCRETLKKYSHQICVYNDETLTLAALAKRFSRIGIEHSVLEAKKYLIK